MTQNIFLSCEFTEYELYTVIYKSMDWFFRYEKSYREKEYFDSLTEILKVLQERHPAVIRTYKIKISDVKFNKQLYFFCPDVQSWKLIEDAREHYGLKRKYTSGMGTDIQATSGA